jgi:hypothetical protein
MRKEEVARAPLSSGCTRCPFRVQLDPNRCGIMLVGDELLPRGCRDVMKEVAHEVLGISCGWEGGVDRGE